MEDSPAMPPSLHLDDQGHIDQDIDCLGCQYNLRTLSADANCPECGRPVIDLPGNERLCLTDPRWIKRLSNGLDTILIGIFVYWILYTNPKLLPSLFLGSTFRRYCLPMMLWLAIGAGIWLFTSPQPNVTADLKFNRARRLVRFAVVAMLCLKAASMLIDSLWQSVYDSTGIVSYIPASAIASIGTAFLLAAMTGYAPRLARRIPMLRFAKFSFWILWIWALMDLTDAILTVAFARTFNYTLGSNTVIKLMDLLKPILIGFQGVHILFGIAGMVLMVIYRIHLGKVLQQIN